jgi:hypothetical protein
MAAAFGLNGVSGAGAVYFRFGNGGDWDDLAAPGGIPQIPVACFDYIDAVRGAAAPRKGDRFGAVLLATLFDAGEAVDLIVGAPATDVASVDGVVKNAGVVWIGLNQETTPGPFDGEFVGDFRDDACGGGLAATMTMTVRHREEAVCGLLASSRALCFGTEDEHALIEPIDLPIIAGGLDDPGAMHLQFVLRDDDDDKLGTLFVDAAVADEDADLVLDLRFVGRGQADGIERSEENLVLERQ